MSRWHAGLAAGVLALLNAFVAPPAAADEAAIRRNLPMRIPDLPRINEVRPSAMPGLWEVRLGTALDRNLALQQRHGVVGTPSLVFRDGQRFSGVMTMSALEGKFASLSKRR